MCGQQKGLPFWEALRRLVRWLGAAQPPEREAGPGIGAGRMIGRSEKAIGNDARDRPDRRQRATAKLVRLHKAAGHTLRRLRKAERRWRTRARNDVGHVQVNLT